ncbi:MAG TPA: regulatory iron-sulfur-containing complex subunit RicT [Candidatus Cloacimonas acidaminovorans]|nr:regulatory iron-sulfur-containing complex subunit RicT [Candidatus Cloacimonas acidaminovorans]HRS61265.1 regulatory iron-sulfur-containing complex subunit RicT [Candidatus Cloacimonas sp.]HOM79646.1 regulatory iron-sulfur-containing complex subunit RicT [Candidatus Cloacimonas acidaminovorans]HOS07833.1 regulatory iron-sulfur-containing complex subunit RicT [Candidatus Cloacimonas acidaminovorans]HOT39183.1 regulatory iron-sulfur-containing complex subunit RicT [Candidatus Cloacimonas acida
MSDFIEVIFRTGRIGYYQNTKGLNIQPEDIIIVEVERGDDIAQVIHLGITEEELDAQVLTGKTLSIRRQANSEDLEKMKNLSYEEDKAAKTFLGVLDHYPFEMKLIETIYQFDGNKLTFFFTADGRIDFRNFVRELANIFKTRIELHQTTGRDEARRLGGFGMCGKQYCCGSFLKRFNQVTIKMAKDQNLAGNLTKISGPCGRLLCCLNFEEDFYVEEAKGFPLVGTFVTYQNTKMMVFRLNVLAKKVMLASEEGIIQEIDLDEFSRLPVISVPILEEC